VTTDFINDVGTHSAGVLAEYGRKTMVGEANWDNLRTAVNDWLDEAGVVMDLDGIRAMLTALSLVLTRADTYLKDPAANRMTQLVLAECAATLVDIFENPRIDLSGLEE
jgi:hypothetical protein